MTATWDATSARLARAPLPRAATPVAAPFRSLTRDVRLTCAAGASPTSSVVTDRGDCRQQQHTEIEGRRIESRDVRRTQCNERLQHNAAINMPVTVPEQAMSPLSARS